MNEVRLTIDGKEASVSQGTTVLEAAQSIGIDIPHLCYGDGLSPTADCRLCVVEVSGGKTLVPSCARPVAANPGRSSPTSRASGYPSRFSV